MNACLRIRHIPRPLKIVEVIVIAKPEKPPIEISSYRPISILPVMSKQFQKLILNRHSKIIVERELIPYHWFVVRCKHSTIYRITDIVEKPLEEMKICSAVGRYTWMLLRPLKRYVTRNFCLNSIWRPTHPVNILK